MTILYYIVTSLCFFYILGLPFIILEQQLRDVIKFPFKVSSFMAYNALIIYGFICYIKLIIYFISLLLGANQKHYTERLFEHIMYTMLFIVVITICYWLSFNLFMVSITYITWTGLLVYLICDIILIMFAGLATPLTIIKYFNEK